MKPRTPKETYGPALDLARARLAELAPTSVSAQAGAVYTPVDPSHGSFSIPIFGAMHQVDWPDGRVKGAADWSEVDITIQILLLHYLLTADGTPLTSRWIAFRNLPGGLGYDMAFQGRANQRLARVFGDDLTAFCEAARSLGGERLAFGDASFSFRVLPCVWMAVVLHLANEEFAAQANVLFDESAPHYLPTEDLAVLGGLLASRLIRAARPHAPAG